ncbi:MAG: Ig-like domain-containing protein [Paludibacteraceae bacterium]|nr:Ig-like domain-containing protein [Paludibacteraceae bacterium]
MKRLFYIICVVCFGVVFTQCKKDKAENLSLQFTQSSVEIEEGGDFNLKKILNVEPKSAAENLKFNWSVANSEIVKVEGNGWIIGEAMGETTVTVEANGKSAKVKVIVTELSVTSFSVPATYKGIAVNVPYALSGVEIEPSGVNQNRINWKSTSDKLSFSYNSDERLWYLTATEAGEYSIGAVIGELEEQKSVCTVSVKKITSLNLSQTSIALLSTGSEKRTATLTYNIEPEDASYKDVEWSVTGDDCIEFNDGEITAKDDKEGTSVITLRHKATAKGDADIEEKCTVTVTKSAPVDEFDISVNSKNLMSGESFDISVKDVTPSTASTEYIRWESDSPDDVQLSVSSGASCTVKAIAKENKTVNVKAIAPNGFEKVCTVTISIIPVVSIKFNNGSDLIVFAGKTYNLPKATVTPKNATLADDVEYKVSEQSVTVTVNEADVSYKIPSGLSNVVSYTVTAICGGKSAEFVMYGVPSNFMSLITPESAYSEFGTFGMGENVLKPSQLIKSEYKSSPVASKLMMRYVSTSGTANKAIVETETYSAGSEYSEFKYDYNYNIVSSTSSFNRTNVVFRLVLSDINGEKLVSGSMNTYFYNSVVNYTYETVQKNSNDKIVNVNGDISPSKTLNLDIVRDGSTKKIYAPAFTIYAEYYTNSGKSETKSFEASYSSRSDYSNVYEDVIRNMQIFSSNATKSKTGTVDFTVKFKK